MAPFLFRGNTRRREEALVNLAVVNQSRLAPAAAARSQRLAKGWRSNSQTAKATQMMPIAKKMMVKNILI